MATPMTSAQFLKALKAEGLSIHEHPGWEGHNRNGSGRAWGPVNGVVIHHTGSDVQTEAYVKNILWSGYSGLPGPLCHVGIGMDGTVHLISSGRANHAGGGDPKVLDLVINEAPSLMTKEAKPTKGNSNGTDGNARFYGAEVMYDGGQAMTAAQEDAAVRFAAAICRFYGWSERSVIGHREWSRDKIDPGTENMVTFRQKVKAQLSGKATATKTPTKTSSPVKTTEPAKIASPCPNVSARTDVPYGKKDKKLWPGKGYHTGSDYPSKAGWWAVAVIDGTVTYMGRDSEPLGYVAVLTGKDSEGKTRSYWYCHVKKGSRQVGKVKAGDKVAQVWDSGTGAHGAHLHFEDKSSPTNWLASDRAPRW